MTFEEYLKKNFPLAIDHRIRAHVYEGVVTFYVHPMNASGDTLDFVVEGNSLKPRN